MNYYFLIEDEQSFLKVLPIWLKHIGFKATRVADISEVEENNYVLQSGQGVTQLITKALYDTIDTILTYPNKIDKLIVILDAENETIDQRKNEVQYKINEKYPDGLNFEIKTFVCNRCFETWLLGHKGLYPASNVDVNNYFYEYYTHYNIEKNDPEDMNKPECCGDSIGKYHFHYLHELFRYLKIRYRKKKPDYVAQSDYFNKIVERINSTTHLNSFREFYEFLLEEIN